MSSTSKSNSNCIEFELSDIIEIPKANRENSNNEITKSDFESGILKGKFQHSSFASPKSGLGSTNDSQSPASTKRGSDQNVTKASQLENVKI
mmetsp:Transcript_18968/g.21791  ORF Transcript_18968/g.21791 Transcript_18968/m.21791 type:complete len:92 (+) Transcript_18968:33-308(+)